MKKNLVVVVLPLALVLGFGNVAEARDIEITVPVRINDLHPTITVGRVQCAALTSLADSGRMVGSASHADFNLTRGSFTGNITVRLSLAEAWMRDVHAWRCELRFVRPYDGPAHSLSLEGGGFFREEFRLVPGSERRFQVQGSL